MTVFQRFIAVFHKLSPMKQTCCVVFVAVIGADVMTLIFYSIFFADRLLLDLLLTAIITVVVGFPIAYFFLGLQAKLARMTVELDRVAHTDSLTDLANRRAFLDATATLFSGGNETDGALLFIDADHFKSINDTFGHAMGDAVLRTIAHVIRASVRDGDLTGRIGGEEFAVFLVGASQSSAAEVAERIRQNVQSIAEPLGVTDRDITVSVGVSMRDRQQTIAEMLLHADQNLYQAKSLGRNRVVGLNEARESAASPVVVESPVALSKQCKGEAPGWTSGIHFCSPSTRSENKTSLLDLTEDCRVKAVL
nr:GGDEF domain-containing protein [Rhizobium sp. Q54]